MHQWEQFLDSLATRGGTILVLLLLTMLGGGAVVHVLHNDPGNEAMRNFVMSTATGFGSALTLALTGGAARANGRARATDAPAPARTQKEDSNVQTTD